MNPIAEPAVTIKQVVPFFAVANIEQSVRYYVDGLGFSMPKKWVVDGKLRWCWLERGGAALMLQEFFREGQDAWVPSCRVGEGVSLNFTCDNAIAFYHDVKSRGIEASEPQVGNSMWVTSLKDPDGYKLFFASDTDVPEDTKLSEMKG